MTPLTPDDFYAAIEVARRRAGIANITRLERLAGVAGGLFQPSHRAKRRGAIGLDKIAKVLHATGTSIDQWAQDVENVRLERGFAEARAQWARDIEEYRHAVRAREIEEYRARRLAEGRP